MGAIWNRANKMGRHLEARNSRDNEEQLHCDIWKSVGETKPSFGMRYDWKDAGAGEPAYTDHS